MVPKRGSEYISATKETLFETEKLGDDQSHKDTACEHITFVLRPESQTPWWILCTESVRHRPPAFSEAKSSTVTKILGGPNSPRCGPATPEHGRLRKLKSTPARLLLEHLTFEARFAHPNVVTHHNKMQMCKIYLPQHFDVSEE